MAKEWFYLVRLPSNRSCAISSHELEALNEVVDLINKATREAGLETFENKKQ